MNLASKVKTLTRLRSTEPGHFVAPASPIQEQFWTASQLSLAGSAFNIVSLFRICGDLDVSAIENGVNAIISRHSTFRTTFHVEEGLLLQVIRPERPIEITVADFSGDEAVSSDKKGELFLRKEAERPFDLVKGPLIRGCILKNGSKEFCLLIVMHHIVTDLATKDLFSRELSLHYNSSVSGDGATYGESVPQYVDYVSDYNRWLKGDECRRMISFWRKCLKGRPEYLNLPTDFSRPPVMSLRGGAVPFQLSRVFTEQLKAFSRRNNVTVYLTLLATYLVLLYRYSGQRAIVTGVPLTNRRCEKYKRVMGCFVTILPLVADFSGDPGFQELLRQVRSAMLDMHRNQEIPVKIIVDEIQAKRDPSYNPIFQTGFTFEHPMDLNLHGLTTVPVSVHGGTSQLDLFPVLWESKEGISGHIEYNADLFEAATIERFADHFKNLLTAVMDDVGTPVSCLPLLSVKEREKILLTWNNTERKYPHVNGIHRLFETQARKKKDATALVYNNVQVTYGELNQRANQLAHFLIASGVVAGTPVGIFLERSIEMVLAIYGILKAGGAYVPLDPEYPDDRIGFMENDIQAPVILTQSRFKERLAGGGSMIVCLDSEQGAIGQYPSHNPDVPITCNDPAYIIYTSGSTGRPKGVVNTHNGISNRILWMQDEYGLTAHDAVLQKTPYSFDVSVWEFFWPLLAGARLVIAPPGVHRDTARLVRLIKENSITTLHFVPSMLQVFLEYPEALGCRSIKRVICSGEVLSSDLQRRFFICLDAELHNLYGPTEAAVDVTHWACRRGDNRTTVPIGKPIANTRIYILDRHMQPVPVGVPGELHIEGVQVASGYLNRPELTAEKFVCGAFEGRSSVRFYKTGDLARYLPDGNIEYIGRSDFQVKVRGLRIEAGEIETVILDHCGIAQAVAVLKDYGSGDCRIIAYMVPDSYCSCVAGKAPEIGDQYSGGASDEAEGHEIGKSGSLSCRLCDEVKQLVKSKLPDYMVPSAFILLDEMPLTQSGKIDRRSLPEPLLERSGLKQEYVAPQSDIEKLLAGLWKDILKIDRVGVEDNFFDIGGNSLLGAYLIAQIRFILAREISVVRLFQYPTINAFSNYLSKDNNEEDQILLKQIKECADSRRKNIKKNRKKCRRR